MFWKVLPALRKTGKGNKDDDDANADDNYDENDDNDDENDDS